VLLIFDYVDKLEAEKEPRLALSFSEDQSFVTSFRSSGRTQVRPLRLAIANHSLVSISEIRADVVELSCASADLPQPPYTLRLADVNGDPSTAAFNLNPGEVRWLDLLEDELWVDDVDGNAEQVRRRVIIRTTQDNLGLPEAHPVTVLRVKATGRMCIPAEIILTIRRKCDGSLLVKAQA
jgi:hypothetical protein